MNKPNNNKFISVTLKEPVKIYNEEYNTLKGVLFKDDMIEYRDLTITNWNNVKEWRYASPMEV